MKGELLKPERFLQVGIDVGEVILQLPGDQPVDKRGAGWLSFTPDQARALARSLLRKAWEAEHEHLKR